MRDKGVDHVYEILKDNFIVESVSPKLKTLYGLPWKRIYTTNYDNAIELSRQGIYSISSITTNESSGNLTRGSIVHLNGFIKRVTPSNIDQNLLLTDASYAASKLVETGWLSAFERDINSSRSIIFVGYSLYDFEIDKVLLNAESIKSKAFFFVAPNADKIELSTLSRYGLVVDGGVDALVKIIDSVSVDYKPPTFVGGFTALRELKAANERLDKLTPARKVHEQLVYGRLPEVDVLLQEKAFGDNPYIVRRSQDIEALQALRDGPWRDILFVGEIASGKSSSVLTLSGELIADGYQVYYAIESSSLLADIGRISEADSKIAIIFEGYSKFKKEIISYASIRKPRHRIVLTERSGIHEIMGTFVDKTPHLGPVREIVLERIRANDIPAFEALTNFGGFWGDRAGISASNRQKIILHNLEGSLYRLLLEIIESQKVQQEIKAILEPVSKDKRILKAFCSILAINSLGFEFTISEWLYLFDRNLIGRMTTEFSDSISHFVLRDSDRIFVRNGLISGHILRAFIDDSVIRECLVELYSRAEGRRGNSREWENLTIELTKFGAVEKMFGGPNKNQNILDYYDTIRAFGGTANNPDYWLQLGIAATVYDDLERGKLCFENAYARERAKKRPNVTRIDNYFSRFEMRLAVSDTDPDNAFRTFIQASGRLERQIFLDINRHYPFKAGRDFAEVAARHFSAWSDGQKKKFREAVSRMRDKAEEWKTRKREVNPDVEILIRETTSLLNSGQLDK